MNGAAMHNPDVLIVGAGPTGLCCGLRLAECGVSFQILEASDGVGGRLRTDVVDGFRLDRGLQFYFTACPEGRRVLDLDALDLKPFARAALVWYHGNFHRLADPRCEPLTAIRSLSNPLGTIADKLRLVRLAWEIERGQLRQQLMKEDGLTLDLLRWKGKFTATMIDRVFRPVLGAVFVERNLTTSSRLFRFVFRMFSEGACAVPALGMQAIPDQLASRLPQGSIRLETRVAKLGAREITLVGGEILRSRAVVVATDGPSAARLIGEAVPDPGSTGTVTLYYATDRPPVPEPIMMFDGEGHGPVNHAAVMSNVSPSYAPAGQSLIAASTVGVPVEDDAEVERRARIQFAGWFGSEVMRWRLLRVYRIPNAAPDQTAGKLDPWQRSVRMQPGLYVCGDHRDNGTLDGAMTSGFRAAQAAMEDLHAGRC